MPMPSKPLEQKRRLGNPGKRPLPAVASTIALAPAQPIPKAPTSLSRTGKKMYNEIWRTANAWLSPALDGPTVMQICRLYEQIEQMQRSLDQYGILLEEPIVTPLGEIVGQSLKPNPAARMMRQAEVSLRGLLSDLGFTPTARSRLGLAEVKKQSKLEELMERRARASG